MFVESIVLCETRILIYKTTILQTAKHKRCWSNVPNGRVAHTPEWLTFAKTPPKSSLL